MIELALALCALGAAGLLILGGLALVAPERLAQSYGVPVHDRSALAFVRAAGTRDLIIGALLATNVYLQSLLMLAIICGCGVVLALADFLIAFSTAREWRSQLSAHIGGAIGFAALVAVLLRALQH